MNSQSPLLKLPRELRDQIVGYVFEEFKQNRKASEHDYASHQQMTTVPFDHLPTICEASKQFYYETTPDFLSRITPILHNIDSICWLRRWLATFPSGSGFLAIRQLAFRNFHGPEQIKGYELIDLCPNLRRLNVMFGDEYSNPGTIPSLAIKSLGSSYTVHESLDDIIITYQLRRLLEVPKLERLDFGFHDWEQPISLHRAREMTEWLDAKFRAQGRNVRIGCRQILYNHTDDN